MVDHQNEATKTCEAVLSQVRNEYANSETYPSAVSLVDRLLQRSTELEGAYQDILTSTGGSSHQIRRFFDSLLMAGCFWHPNLTKEMRDDVSRINELNAKISQTAYYLSSLLEELEGTSRAFSTAYYDPISLIKSVGSQNSLFNAWVEKDLSVLINRFDGKYWPLCSEILDELSDRFADAGVDAGDPVSKAAIRNSRHSKADFFRALFKHLHGQTGPDSYDLDKEFRLRDESWASLANCILDLGSDELVDGAYVKRLRQRMRNE